MTRAACGDLITRDGDKLVIEAALPIEGLEVSRYRKPVLRYENERYTLQQVQAKPLVYRFVREDPNLYEPAGDVVIYDGERHLDRRRDRQRTALAWLLWIPTVPLMPVIGLLPQSWKDKLVHVGVNPGTATRLSVNFEYLLLVPLVILYFMFTGFWTLPGFIIGALTLFICADIAYRVTADADNQTPGMFAVAGELKRFLAGLVAAAPGQAAVQSNRASHGREGKASPMPSTRDEDRLLDDDGKPIDQPKLPP